MKKINYESPQIEVVEIEIENSVLSGSGTDNPFDGSGLDDFTQGNW